MDKDSGMAGVSGLSQRDQRRRQDAGFVGATQAREPQAGVFWLWSGGQRNCRDLRTGGRDLPWSEYRTTVVIELYRVRCPDCGIKAEKVALAEQGALQQALRGSGGTSL
jgi:hypothetical protein